MPFSLEGFAFFTEAIFLGVYLYGWTRVSPLVSLAVRGGCGHQRIFSGIFVVTANAWMNSPAGFKMVDGKLADIDPIAAMLNPASFHEVVHMTLAALWPRALWWRQFHAFFLLRDRDNLFHRAALGLALRSLYLHAIANPQWRPECPRGRPTATGKLAAMEAHYRTQAGAPLMFRRDSGRPNDDDRLRPGDSARIEPPRRAQPERESGRPGGVPARPMAKCAGRALVLRPYGRFGHADARADALCECLMAEIPAFCLIADGFLRGLVAAGPLGFLAIETGWMVTEGGRQPWIIYGVMRTRDAVTPMPRLVVPFAIFTAAYIFLAMIVVLLLRRQFLETGYLVPASPAR